MLTEPAKVEQNTHAPRSSTCAPLNAPQQTSNNISRPNVLAKPLTVLPSSKQCSPADQTQHSTSPNPQYVCCQHCHPRVVLTTAPCQHQTMGGHHSSRVHSQPQVPARGARRSMRVHMCVCVCDVCVRNVNKAMHQSIPPPPPLLMRRPGLAALPAQAPPYQTRPPGACQHQPRQAPPCPQLWR